MFRLTPLIALFLTVMACRAGTLSASYAEIPAGTEVDLTQAGALDWVHWGLITETSVDRKAGVTPQISDFNLLYGDGGFAFVYQFADNLNGYTWTDGTPHMVVTNTTTGVWAYSLPAVGSGFQFSAPAGTNPLTLRVYVGAYNAGGRFTAILSDNSAPPYTSEAVVNRGTGLSGVYTINYSAGSTGGVLNVTYMLSGMFGQNANVTLQAAALTAPGANNLPIVTLASPAEGLSFSAPTNLTLSANAVDVDGSVTMVGFFAGDEKVGETTTAPYEVTWTNPPLGRYVVTARAIDDKAGVGISVPVTVFVTDSGSNLVGSRASAPLSANLTAEGTSDWAHWGLLSASNFNHKASGGSQISDLTQIGTNRIEKYSDNRTAFSWSDGTPVVSVTSSNDGVYVYGLRDGFEISAPADTNQRTLRVYAGLYGAQGNFQAWLSDFSAPAFTDTTLSNAFGNSYAVYTIKYAAATNGQKLHIRFTAQNLFDTLYGNVTLQAATLQGPPPASPTVELRNPIWSGNDFAFSFETETGRAYRAEYATALPAASWITFTNLTGTGGTAWVTNVVEGDTARFYRVTRQ